MFRERVSEELVEAVVTKGKINLIAELVNCCDLGTIDYIKNLTLFMEENLLDGDNRDVKLDLFYRGWIEVFSDLKAKRESGMTQDEFMKEYSAYDAAYDEILETGRNI